MTAEDGTIRILHVEDEAGVADLAATFLEREDERFAVESAASVDEGLERLVNGSFDCVVSDYDLPGRDGIAFLETVRETHPDLPFILFTGKGSEEVASEAISAGATDYLQKQPDSSQFALLANAIGNGVEQSRAKQELAASERRLSLFIDQSSLGVIEWDLDFRLVRMNDAAETILGYEEAELVGRSWQPLVPESDRAAVAAVVEDVIEDRGGYHSINENVRKDGERIVCEWHNRVVTDETGEVVAVFSQFQDVTDRHVREQTVEELHGTARSLMDAESATAVAELTVHAARDILDLPFNGIHFYDEGADALVPAAWTDEGEALAGEIPTLPVESLAGEAYEAGEVRTFDDVSATPGRLNPDTVVRGEMIIPLDDHGVLVIGADVPDAFDEVDISLAQLLADHATAALDRVEREADVRRNERRLERLHQASESLLQASSPEQVAERVVEAAEDILEFPITVVRLHREAAGGLVPVAATEAAGEVLGTPVVYGPASGSLNWNAYESGETVIYGDISDTDRAVDDITTISSFMILPLGEHGTISVGDTAPRSFDEVDTFHGELLASTATLALSQLDREAALIQQRDAFDRQNERLTQFANVVSHDLRNPLNVAQGRIELATEDCDSEHLPPVRRAVDRMEALIDDVLALARAGEHLGATEPVTLGALAERSWRHVETESAQLVVETTAIVEADRSRLQQLFENLFRNAVDHGGDDITVTVGDLGDGFYVEDTGGGIPDSERKSVFEAGYSGDADGTGFGLSIVNEIAQAHGWSINLTSGVAGGARFEFTGVDPVGE